MIELKPYIDEHYILDFFGMLNKEDIKYALIKNIDGELPSRLKDGKDIDILVHIDDRERFARVMSEHNWMYRTPPLGREAGWNFGYNLPEYQFWQYQPQKIDQIFYVDACFKLMCKSLMPKVWIPLNEPMQKKAWQEQEWNEELKCWQLGPKTLFVYLFVREVFDKHEFKDEYIQEIEKRKKYLEDDEVYELLKTVFFGFTDELIKLVKNGEYKTIVRKYITYQNY